MLEIVKIESGYSSLRVIKGISLEVPKSKLVTIIGPNGHGKTTLLRSISGVLRLQSGEINFEWKRIDNLRVDEIVNKGIVHIPQGDMLFPEMNVKDNLLMGAYLVRNQPELKNRITQVLELFPQLGERENQIASTLSGGERRMLAIGRGLMTVAKILLIDEPSLGLAPVVIDDIFKILKELNNQGQTILLVEENVSRVINVSDHIYLIDDGLIAWQGTGEELSSESNIMEVYLGV